MDEKKAAWMLAAIILFLSFFIWLVEWSPERVVEYKPTVKAITDTPPKAKTVVKKKAHVTARVKTHKHVRVSRDYPRIGARTNAMRYAEAKVGPQQWPCLAILWERESGWSPTSDNPTSSAYGIPQILGLEARVGSDPIKQVDAGLSYIGHRYGSPCKAWRFWQKHRWY